jgi:hypothetical protein
MDGLPKVTESSQLLTEGEAAIYLSLPMATLRKNRWQLSEHLKRGPLDEKSLKKLLPFVKLGKSVRYRRQDLDRYLQINLIGMVAS